MACCRLEISVKKSTVDNYASKRGSDPFSGISLSYPGSIKTKETVPCFDLSLSPIIVVSRMKMGKTNILGGDENTVDTAMHPKRTQGRRIRGERDPPDEENSISLPLLPHCLNQCNV